MGPALQADAATSDGVVLQPDATSDGTAAVNGTTPQPDATSDGFARWNHFMHRKLLLFVRMILVIT